MIFTAGRALVGESAVRVVGVPEQDLVAGLVLLGVAAGGGAGEMTKGADEMGVVGETGQLPACWTLTPSWSSCRARRMRL